MKETFELRAIRFVCFLAMGIGYLYLTYMMVMWFTESSEISMEKAAAFGAFITATFAFSKHFMASLNKEIDDEEKEEKEDDSDKSN
jgi:hypothetical protein